MPQDPLYKSLVTSLGVSIPGFFLSVFLMETQIQWPHPAWIILGILAGAVVNFGVIITLDRCREKIGHMTIPALLAVVGVVLMYLIAEALNRFIDSRIGYSWLFPFVVLSTGLCLLAIFKEKKIALKCHLAANSVIIAVLWALGTADKIALPF
jgi:hypothetical protein